MDTMKYEVHGLDIRDPQYPLNRFYRQDINRQFSLDEEYDAVIHLALLIEKNNRKNYLRVLFFN